MGLPVVHFEIIGSDPEGLQRYYGDLFGWTFEVGDTVSENVSQPGRYGFVSGETVQINGGIGGGDGFRPSVLFYVGVDDVEAALKRAEKLGGTRRMGPEGRAGALVVGHFTDPEGNLVGVAGSA
ncbi:VOC family protein [Actinoplanes solisilvae]|uniref:VOC family protein n=1 Tax=Actinoplanes solisilvae TaxID=2486853 RepID=UPI000FD91BC8|nr:VOC family protein [Actinoplanes solisilvae]